MSAACASCLACGSIVSDVAGGWVRNQERPSDPRVWFLCAKCLDRKPYLAWSDEGPSLRFYSLCSCCSRKAAA